MQNSQTETYSHDTFFKPMIILDQSAHLMNPEKSGFDSTKDSILSKLETLLHAWYIEKLDEQTIL